MWSNALSLPETGAPSTSEQAWTTVSMPPGSCAAAKAECEAEQNLHWLRVET